MPGGGGPCAGPASLPCESFRRRASRTWPKTRSTGSPRAAGDPSRESVAVTIPDESRPLLWLRARPRRTVLVEHLLHVAGAFAAAGWEIARGELGAAPAGAALAVLDDPWVEPLPRLAVALAAARVAGPPAWRVPRLLGLTGPQGWNPAPPPATMREYERVTVRRGGGAAVALGPAAWCGFAVAPPRDAADLLRSGWPPE